MDNKSIIIYLGILFLFINTILYFKSYRKNLVAFKFFSLCLLLTLLIQVLNSYYFETKGNNLYLSHYYFIGQFILLSFFFRQILRKKVQKKLIILVLISALIILSIYYVLYPLDYFKFNIFEIVLTSVPLIVYCFFFFIQKIEDADKNFIYIVSGFFLYLLCSTLLFTAGNITAEIKNVIWYSNAILYIVYQVLIFVEWYKHFRKKELVVIEDNNESVY